MDFYISNFPRDTQYIVFGALLYVFYVCLQFCVYIIIEKKIKIKEDLRIVFVIFINSALTTIIVLRISN